MIDLPADEDHGWVSLRQASQKLGVSPATLRAWADEGRVQSYRTPGGHRRFRVNEASTPFPQEKRGGDTRWRLLEHSVVGRVQLAREAREAKRLTPQARSEERAIERELIRLGTLALQRGEGELAEPTAAVGTAYGKLNWRHDIPPRDALETLAHLRRALVAGVVEFAFGMGEPDVDELNVWLGRVNDVIDRVSQSMLEYRHKETETNAGK